MAKPIECIRTGIAYTFVPNLETEEPAKGVLSMTRLFEDEFFGSVVTANAVRDALYERQRRFDGAVTVQMALTVTDAELLLRPGIGKRKLQEFLEWKNTHRDEIEDGKWSISHWGIMSVEMPPLYKMLDYRQYVNSDPKLGGFG